MNLTTDDDLAGQFGITVEKLHELRKRKGWPHVRLGRFDIRFTDEQVEQIVALHSENPDKPKVQTTPAITGQTTKSASRRRAS